MFLSSVILQQRLLWDFNLAPELGKKSNGTNPRISKSAEQQPARHTFMNSPKSFIIQLQTYIDRIVIYCGLLEVKIITIIYEILTDTFNYVR